MLLLFFHVLAYYVTNITSSNLGLCHCISLLAMKVIKVSRLVSQIDSVLKIPVKQQVIGCVHTSGGITVFSLYDCHVLDIRQINDWTKKTTAAWLVSR